MKIFTVYQKHQSPFPQDMFIPVEFHSEEEAKAYIRKQPKPDTLTYDLTHED